MIAPRASSSTASNMSWKFAEVVTTQAVSFIVSLLLARLLLPEHYGTIALATVFTNLASVFSISGFANALIQKREADALDFSSVFYFNIFLSFLMVLLAFIFAPSIGRYFKNQQLVSVIRWLSLIIPLNSVSSVQTSFLSRNFMFRKGFYVKIIGSIVSMSVGIVMAYLQFGIWSLVSQQLCAAIINSILLWVFVPWRPAYSFSLQRLKALFSYGWRLLVAAIVYTSSAEVRTLIIGKQYSSNDLAFFNKGQQIPSIVANSLTTTIDSVMLPTLSRLQDCKEDVVAAMRKSMKLAAFLTWPLITGIAVVSKPLVVILLTEKWVPIIPYLRIACFVYAFAPITATIVGPMKAIGRSDVYLLAEVIKRGVEILLLILVYKKGVIAIALTAASMVILSTVVYAMMNKKLIGYGLFHQAKDLAQLILMNIIMGVLAWLAGSIPQGNIASVMFSTATGVTMYVVLSRAFNVPEFTYILELVRKSICKAIGKDTPSSK